MTKLRLTRRGLINVTAGAATLPWLAPLTGRGLAYAATPARIKPAPAMVPLVLDKGPATRVWAYDGQVPGPLLRYTQGDRLAVEIENGLEEPTTIHWHGLRPPVEMDGVPYLSHPPIAPGETFLYEFDLLDAGTFWYHPHLNSSEQIGRGLQGVLIVDEPQPPKVDRDLVWVLDDWRLDEAAQSAPFGGNMHDSSHAGRIGNAITVNGSIAEDFEVFAGERLRLRLVNTANARTFDLEFNQLRPWLIALDGQPVEPALLANNHIRLGSGQRADLIIDATLSAGELERVLDISYGGDYAFNLMRLNHVAGRTPGLAGSPPPTAMSPNPIAEPDLANAQRHRLVFEGGAMGGLAGAMMDGTYQGMRELAQAGKLWAINGTVIGDAYADPPLLQLSLGQTYILELENRTAFEHPIHVHGHGFRVLGTNAEGLMQPPMRDTVLVKPDETVEIAFVADNPGHWMFHCHILEHQAAAMMAVISVA